MTNDELYAMTVQEVRNIVAELNPPVGVYVNGSRYDDDPAYCVLVTVNGIMLSGCPWVAVTHTEQFGFTPTRDGYTYLEPPVGVDREDREAVVAWLRPVLEAAIVKHVPAAEKARADDAPISGPVEARDAITRIG
jgi:hypothetical protein